MINQSQVGISCAEKWSVSRRVVNKLDSLSRDEDAYDLKYLICKVVKETVNNQS